MESRCAQLSNNFSTMKINVCFSPLDFIFFIVVVKEGREIK
jgi:hypothetical protein